jgi:signal transduction histidine kinase
MGNSLWDKVRTWPKLWLYGVAVAFAVASVAVRYGIDPLLDYDAPIFLSIIAVALSAWLGGMGPGLVATLISVIGAFALFLFPGSLHTNLTPAHLVRLTLFLLTGGILSALTEGMRQSTERWLRAEHEKKEQLLQERNRMAREIHDTLAQGLTGIIIQLEAAEDTLAGQEAEARSHLQRARNLARSSLEEARRSVHALRPEALERQDLATALTQVMEQMALGTTVQTKMTVEGTLLPGESLAPETESELYRIGVEALTNALKHARSRHVWMTLRFASDRVNLSVRDDGQGFLPTALPMHPTFGLLTMRDRAEQVGGELTVKSAPGAGTEVTVRVPLPKRSEQVKEACHV